jgi:hypothetical protein
MNILHMVGVPSVVTASVTVTPLPYATIPPDVPFVLNLTRPKTTPATFQHARKVPPALILQSAVQTAIHHIRPAIQIAPNELRFDLSTKLLK